MHLADAFIQSVLQCIQAIHLWSVWNWINIKNTRLLFWLTGIIIKLPFKSDKWMYKWLSEISGWVSVSVLLCSRPLRTCPWLRVERLHSWPTVTVCRQTGRPLHTCRARWTDRCQVHSAHSPANSSSWGKLSPLWPPPNLCSFPWLIIVISE